MAPRSITPRDQDRPFECDELFFSTTDVKGIIRSGNDVFVRVSGYPISELLGKPHNTIRHPDMPCAVFKLLWDYLGHGKSFAGYVKNMAADGCRYWVMALAVPIPQGYLSVRFKPSSAFLSVAKDIYTEMRGIELAAGDTVAAHRSAMQRSAERLMAVLKEKGFADYDSFMHTALAAEMAQHRDAIAARGRQGLTSPAFASAMCHVSASADELEAMLQAAVTIDRLLDDLFSRVASFLDLIKRLDGKSEFLLELARDIRLISFNAVTTSYRLDQSGRGLTVVTHNLATIMEESTQVITQMTRQISALTSSLREMAFSITSAKLQVEMTIFFLQELLRAKKQGAQSTSGA
ncbi:MAG: PAS domain-containing protein, partial [Pirellulaceae bacterium]